MYFVVDTDRVRDEYAARLRMAEHERLCQKLKRQHPPMLVGLRQFLGDRLIAVGMRLKVQSYAELAPSSPNTSEA